MNELESAYSLEQEERQALAELSALVDSYNPTAEYFYGIVCLALVAVCVSLIYSLGLLIGLLLIAFGLIPILLLAIHNPNLHLKNKAELSEQVCIIMNRCVNMRKYPASDTSRMILTYSMNGNLSLYREFIRMFPHMKSKKIEKLASMKHRR